MCLCCRCFCCLCGGLFMCCEDARAKMHVHCRMRTPTRARTRTHAHAHTDNTCTHGRTRARAPTGAQTQTRSLSLAQVLRVCFEAVATAWCLLPDDPEQPTPAGGHAAAAATSGDALTHAAPFNLDLIPRPRFTLPRRRGRADDLDDLESWAGPQMLPSVVTWHSVSVHIPECVLGLYIHIRHLAVGRCTCMLILYVLPTPATCVCG